jgi:hypothetical protein
VLCGQGGVNTDILFTALQTAISRRAPWLRGKLAKIESGSVSLNALNNADKRGE